MMKKFTLVDKAFYLKKTPLFYGLDLDLLLPIADQLGVLIYEASEVIFSPGDPAKLLYFIVEGHVSIRLPEGEAVILDEGEFFGDESLFSGDPRQYEAITETDVTLLALSKAHLHAIINECPNVGLAFLKLYSAAVPFFRHLQKTSEEV